MTCRTSSPRPFFAPSLGAAFLLGCLVGAGACSAEAIPPPEGGNPGAAPPPPSPGGGQGGEDGEGGLSPGAGAPSDQGFEECATSSQEATLVPLNMMIMFDRSGSMQDSLKWRKSTAALKAFIQDPGSAGLRVALRFFPDDDCNEGTCDVAACSVPAIEAAPLTEQSGAGDPQERRLVSTIAEKMPYGAATPMYAALAGAELWATSYLDDHPSEKALVILVTDGAPNGCDEDTGAIAALAEQAHTASGVLTYAVGLVGSYRDIMDEIAQKGGTGQGFFIGNGNAEAELLAALQAIQGSQVACELQMPEVDRGETLDPTLINVTYTAGAGTESVLGQVGGPNACSPQVGGWYYDNPVSPSRISFCPSTCQIVQADPAAKVKIVVGCGTKPAR